MFRLFEGWVKTTAVPAAEFTGSCVLEVGPKVGHHTRWLASALRPSELVLIDLATAVDHATQAAYLIRDQGDRYVQATSIRQLAVLLGGIDPTGAAELLGIADALVPDARVSARDAAAGTRLRADLLDSLGTDAFAAAFERGCRLDTVAMYATVSRALNAMRDVAPSATYASSSVPASTRRPDAD